jgi:hypothetical protein
MELLQYVLVLPFGLSIAPFHQLTQNLIESQSRGPRFQPSYCQHTVQSTVHVFADLPIFMFEKVSQEN